MTGKKQQEMNTGTPKRVSFTDDYRLSKQEWLILHTIEDILLLMEDRNATKQQLADKMGKSKLYITSILRGGRDMTLRELSDIVYWLGGTATVNIKKY